MTQTLMCSTITGRARASAGLAAHAMRWLGGHDVFPTGAGVMGAVGYSHVTATKRNIPGVLIGGLT